MSPCNSNPFKFIHYFCKQLTSFYLFYIIFHNISVFWICLPYCSGINKQVYAFILDIFLYLTYIYFNSHFFHFLSYGFSFKI